LEQVLLPLRKNAPPIDARVVAGSSVPDDAVVVETPGGELMIQTLDFFTPLCDDPYLFGQIAAANSLSDVYAMGGVPYTAMNICCFPISTVGTETLSLILQGGMERVLAAGAVPSGGHTVEDAEPKFGLSVTGFVRPEHLTIKGGARPGQLLVLSKPIGTGVLTTAVKRGQLTEAEISQAFDGMKTLNHAACLSMHKAGVRAATDITGYGLLGHAWEMIRGGEVDFVFEAEKVPLYEGALEFARTDVFPGGSRANRAWLETIGAVNWRNDVPEALKGLLTDAQTSGGLLMAWPPECEVPGEFWVVGRVEAAGEGGARLVVV
jgi:selenide,water dikinase